MSGFLTAVEVADLLKISKALSYRWIARGLIPSFRVGRTVRVKQEDLEEFVRRNSSETLGNSVVRLTTGDKS